MGDVLSLTALTAHKELAAAFDQLDAHLHAKSQQDDQLAQFRPRTRGGYSTPGVYWFPDDKFWAQLGIELGGTRYWGAYGLTSPYQQSEGVPVCEINPPLEGRGAGCSGAFAHDETGHVYYLHTGKFGGRYKDLRADVFLEIYEGIQAHVTWPESAGDRARRMCVVGRLDDERLVQSIGAFVHAVSQFKKQMLERRTPPPNVSVPIGRPYSHQPEPQPRPEREPYTVDPDIVGRGVRAHWETQSKLVRYLRDELGLTNADEILEWGGTHLLYDVLWRTRAGAYWVAEVKSLTKVNEDHQLRLGLGQVLQYRWWLSKTYHTTVTDVRAALVVERAPTRAREWQEVCAEAGVILVWPEVLHDLSGHDRSTR